MSEPTRPEKRGDLVIELTVPGSDSFLQLIRSVVGRAALMAGFSFDGIEDFALAVDEAATLLFQDSPTSLRLNVTGMEHGELVATLDLGPDGAGWPPTGLEQDTGWQVLSALCDRVWVLDRPERSGIGLSQRAR